MTVTPCFLTRFLSDCITSKADEESNPLVGSSRKRQAGFDMSSTPMFTRFFSPPETPRRFTSPTILLATRDKPRLAKVASARSSISLIDIAGECKKEFRRHKIGRTTFMTHLRLVPLGELNRPEYTRHSFTVNSANTISSCGTKPVKSL
jgi:hypothetical protein